MTFWPIGPPANRLFRRARAAPEAPMNSGRARQTMGSPKAGLVLYPFNASELYLNFGEGLKAAARAAQSRILILTTARRSVNPVLSCRRRYSLSRAAQRLAFERGRSTIENLDTTLTFFWQDFDSENLFEGDEGTAVFGRPSRRLGFEWTGDYRPTS